MAVCFDLVMLLYVLLLEYLFGRRLQCTVLSAEMPFVINMYVLFCLNLYTVRGIHVGIKIC